MTTIFKIEKEDIKTCKIGENIQIVIDEKCQIIFSREALNEILDDYKAIKDAETKQKK
ncbi:MAG: hypothetical protein H7101_11315 [Deinococcales bacterium]|nr:hypothetical protein [Chitinophagaceae bacterium]